MVNHYYRQLNRYCTRSKRPWRLFKPLTGYDGKTTAEDIHELVSQLGFKDIFLVGHDFGVQVAYSYAAAHPNEVRRLVILDVPIPGIGPGQNITALWWAQFHMVRDIPEMLLEGHEREYLSWFYRHTCNPAAITKEDIDAYAFACYKCKRRRNS